MQALVSSTQIDLKTGAAQITLAAPQRMAASALINQFQRATSGRIINL